MYVFIGKMAIKSDWVVEPTTLTHPPESAINDTIAENLRGFSGAQTEDQVFAGASAAPASRRARTISEARAAISGGTGK